MKLNPILANLLLESDLDQNQAPSIDQWKTLLGRIQDIFDQIGPSQQMLELSYQEVQKMWELIQHREMLTKAIFDVSQDIILVLDEQAQIVEFNLAFQKAIGLKDSEILGRSVFELISQGSLIEDLRICFASPQQEFVEKFLGRRQEKTLCLSGQADRIVSIFPNRIQQGQTTVYSLYIRDLTSEKAAEQAVEQSRLQLISTSKMSALGEMAGGVAHEINTPLTIIQMRADQAQMKLNQEEVDRDTVNASLEAIQTTVSRISKIIDGLRSFARDGSQDPMSPHSATKIVEDTFSLCREMFSNHGVSLTCEVDRDVDIICRPTEISQVLLNLLSNSYDAVESLEEKWVKVEIRELMDQEISISVIDSGSGIPSYIQEKMMQPFFTTKQIGKGTGLGLSISKGIVENHNGKIVVDNTSKNTKISIYLPKVSKGILAA